MPITQIQKLPIGNAVRVFIQPPAGATRWRLLRKTADSFSGQDDPEASVIHDGDERVVLDAEALINGTTYCYKLYTWNGSVWAAEPSVSAVPNPNFTDIGTDVLSVVRDRLDEGLKVYVANGTLTHPKGHIQVLTAPPAFEDTAWPVVTVHLMQDAPGERGIGELIGIDEFDADAWDWKSSEGWLSRVQLTIIGWCLNADQRIALRRALKAIVIGNLPIFDAYGMVQIEFQQSDTEDFQSYAAPVYQVSNTFSCLAPSAVSTTDPAITDVEETITPTWG